MQQLSDDRDQAINGGVRVLLQKIIQIGRTPILLEVSQAVVTCPPPRALSTPTLRIEAPGYSLLLSTEDREYRLDCARDAIHYNGVVIHLQETFDSFAINDRRYPVEGPKPFFFDFVGSELVGIS